ncbi:hypothetical protein Tco_0345870 [Tanacetum coccineum]
MISWLYLNSNEGTEWHSGSHCSAEGITNGSGEVEASLNAKDRRFCGPKYGCFLGEMLYGTKMREIALKNLMQRWFPGLFLLSHLHGKVIAYASRQLKPYEGTKLCVPEDPTLREALMTEAHSSPFSIHPGSTKIVPRSKQHFWLEWVYRKLGEPGSSLLRAFHPETDGAVRSVRLKLEDMLRSCALDMGRKLDDLYDPICWDRLVNVFLRVRRSLRWTNEKVASLQRNSFKELRNVRKTLKPKGIAEREEFQGVSMFSESITSTWKSHECNNTIPFVKFFGRNHTEREALGETRGCLFGLLILIFFHDWYLEGRLGLSECGLESLVTI